MTTRAAVPSPRRDGLAFALVAITLVVLAALPGTARADEPDYSGWRTLLHRYLVVVQAKGQPWDSRFDYEQLFLDEHVLTLRRADGLAAIHTQLLSVSPSDMTPRERTAWAINAYNLLVIERLTVHLLVPLRQLMRYDSPKEVNTDDGTFFAAPVATVDGKTYSLTGFERRFVYGDTTADPMSNGGFARENPGDPRLMFALCKGALCTGPLVPWVYRADSLEAQLDRAARLALALPAYLRPDPASGQLGASNRFFDERADFGGPQLPGLIPFILKHGPAAIRREIQARKLERPTIFFEPNWKLNQFDHPRPKLPGAAGADSSKAVRKSVTRRSAHT
ncbi:MAG TPA: DUF547 domain-containing protein [Candidatus Eisenbacteria bacterium]|jgi:hypothetical protein